MEEQMENKEKKPIGFIVVIVLLILMLLGMGGYIAYDKGVVFKKDNETKETENKSNEKVDTTENKEIQETESKEGSLLLHFDSSKCINKQDVTYTLALFNNSGYGINAQLSQDKKTVNITVAWERIYSLFYINGANTGSQQITLQFSQEVEDFFIGGFGQQASSTTMLFLMKDGSVEYMPLYKAVTTNNFNSYGKLAEVKDIVKFYTADVDFGQPGSGTTILAQKADGTFYDLSLILQNTGQY